MPNRAINFGSAENEISFGLTRSGSRYNKMTLNRTPPRSPVTNGDGVGEGNEAVNLMADQIENTNQTNELVDTSLARNTEMNGAGNTGINGEITEIRKLNDNLIRSNAELIQRLKQAEKRLEQQRNTVTETETPNNGQNSVNCVHHGFYNNYVKFQGFWKSEPDAWFDIFEAQLRYRKIIDDEAKYFNLVQNLSSEIARKVDSRLQVGAQKTKYEALKNALLAKYSLTKEERLSRLMSDNNIGSRKPSEYLNDLLKIAKDAVARDTVITFWKERLSTTIAINLDREINGLNERQNIEKADYIDRVANRQTGSISAVSSEPQTGKLLEKLINEVSHVVARVDALNKNKTQTKHAARN